MNLKTEAIVLSVQKLRDNSSLVNFYTREVGRSSFLLYGAHGRKHSNCAAYLHPLSVVNIDVNLRNSRPLNTIRELKVADANPELLFNPVKSALSFFMSEVLLQVLRTNERDEILFDFIRNSVLMLNESEKGLGNFHILFLVRLTRFLGFQPDPFSPSQNDFFDLCQVEYTNVRPFHNQFLTPQDASQMRLLLRMNSRNYPLFRFTKGERTETLKRILEYYKIHTESFGEIKSLEVLKEIFE